MDNQSKIRVLVVKPGKPAYEKEIPDTLDGYYKEIETDIVQVVYPFDDNVGIICDENGKLNGKELNRTLCDDSGNVYDVIAGTFLVVGLGEENFCSLTEQQIEKYKTIYAHPQFFVMKDGQLHFFR